MGAFFSHVDNTDEKETRLYGVIGKVTSKVPEMKFRTSCAGKWMDLDFFDIFENPFQESDFPKEWLKRVSKSKPKPIENQYKQYYRSKKTNGNTNASITIYNGSSENKAQTANGRLERYSQEIEEHYNKVLEATAGNQVIQMTDDDFNGDDTILEPEEWALINAALDELSETGMSILLAKAANAGYDQMMEAVISTKA